MWDHPPVSPLSQIQQLSASLPPLPQGQMQPLISPAAADGLGCTLRTNVPRLQRSSAAPWALQLYPSVPVLPVNQHPAPKAPHTTEKKDVSPARGAETPYRDTRIQSQPVDLWPNHRKFVVIKILLCKNSRAGESLYSWLKTMLHHAKLLLSCSQLQ